MKWAGLVGAALLLILVGAVLALHAWVGTADFRARAERAASDAVGVPVKLGAIGVDVWPLPAVSVDDVRIGTRPPLTLARVEARPVWSALLAGRAELDTLLVRDAVLPQAALAALGARAVKPATVKPVKPATTATGAARPALPRAIQLENVTWVDTAGRRMTMNARARFEQGALLEDARAEVTAGRFAGARGELRREGDRWPLRVEIGGGRIEGPLRLQPTGSTQLLTGELQSRNVEVAALTAPARLLTGKLQATTRLRAEFREPGQIADALTSQTRFSVDNAVVQGVDLAGAAASGRGDGGITRLDTLTGLVNTQRGNVHLTELVAKSALMAATGNVSMAANGALDGRIAVDVNTMVRGRMSVPLAVGGTVESPRVTPTREAVLDAIGRLLKR